MSVYDPRRACLNPFQSRGLSRRALQISGFGAKEDSVTSLRRTAIKREEKVTMAAKHKGQCFCGTVQVEVSGEPEAMGYCHCRSCRSWSASPVNAFTLWKPEAVRVTAGVEHLATFQKTEFSPRQYCRRCGGHLMTNHPPLDLVDVFAATLPTLKFVPGVHVNYAETVLPMRDGLPKPGSAKSCPSNRPTALKLYVPLSGQRGHWA